MESTSTIRESGSPVLTAAELGLTEIYQGVRETSLRCCAPLTVEDHSLQAMPDASPAKWHLAHTTWFFETFLLADHLPGYRAFHPAFRNLFNSYYNAVGERPLRALRHTLTRPALDEVHAYRSHVDEAMVRLLSRELPPEVIDLVTLGLNHEQQHQELILTDVKYGLAANPLRPAYREAGRDMSNSALTAPASALAFVSRGCVSRRVRGRRVCLRQRTSSPQRLPGTLPAGFSFGHQRRVLAVHARKRL